ncbi:MAG: hypothetical protein M1816_004819 [Peltula sp. TS41687]|nr:MAG: hypothetical protein M1816_004819 [Peltula sp. TS41687]
MPALAQSDSTAPIPLNYAEQIRINVICYLSRRGINSREYWRRTSRETFVDLSGPSLYEDALPCLGNARAYRRWKCEDITRVVHQLLADRGFSPDFIATESSRPFAPPEDQWTADFNRVATFLTSTLTRPMTPPPSSRPSGSTKTTDRVAKPTRTNQADPVDGMNAQVHLAIRSAPGPPSAAIDSSNPLDIMADISRQLSRVPSGKTRRSGRRCAGPSRLWHRFDLLQSGPKLHEPPGRTAMVRGSPERDGGLLDGAFSSLGRTAAGPPPHYQVRSNHNHLDGAHPGVIARWGEQPPSAERRFCLRWSDLDRSSAAPGDIDEVTLRCSSTDALYESSAIRTRLEGTIFSTVVYAFYIHGSLLRWARRLGRMTGDYPTLGHRTYHDRVPALTTRPDLRSRAWVEMLSHTLEFVGHGVPDKLGRQHAQMYRNALETFPDGWPELQDRLKPYLERLYQQMPLDKLWTVQGTRPLLRSASSITSSSTSSLSAVPASPSLGDTASAGLPTTVLDSWSQVFQQAIRKAMQTAVLFAQLAQDPQTDVAASMEARAYVQSHLPLFVERDRLMGLRRTGPSMSMLQQRYPFGAGGRRQMARHPHHFLTLLLTIRVWCFGKEIAIRQYLDMPVTAGPEEWQCLLERLHTSGPGLGMIHAYGQAGRQDSRLESWCRALPAQSDHLDRLVDLLRLGRVAAYQPPTAADLALRMMGGGGKGPGGSMADLTRGHDVQTPWDRIGRC